MKYIYILLILFPIVFSRRQRIVTRGTLLCNTQPYPNAQVKVVSKRIGFDNTLGDVKTDGNGQFLIDGDADEFTELNPQLKIYHHCGDNATFSLNPLKLCSRRWVFKIPTEFISTPGSGNPRVLDVGSLNLELKPVEENRNCF